MKCPKCGYHSFDHLDDCKKCGNDLADHKAKFNLQGLYSPGQQEPEEEALPEPAEAEAATESAAQDDNVDFGFDFLEEDEGSETATGASEPKATDPGIDLTTDEDQVSINQPFSVDGETVPADGTAADSNKKDPDSEFSF